MNNNLPRVHIFTLGCKVNQCDSEELARLLAAHGYTVDLGPDSGLSTLGSRPSTLNSELSTLNCIYIVNTCTVTSTADAKARKLIRHLAKENPQAKIIITGCYADRVGEELARLPGVCAVIPNTRKADLPQILASCRAGGPSPAAVSENFYQAVSQELTNLPLDGGGKGGGGSRRTRAFLKIQDGCDHACAYCIVSTVRGPMSSKPLAQVVEEMTRLCDAGTKEVVLCGIRLGAYRANGISLASLLRALRQIPLPRLRLSSLEPLDISAELLAEFAGHPSLCHHLHLPLQSGDDSVLTSMNRGYRLRDFRRLVEEVRRVWPDVSLTTDLLVGFPGETEEAFQNTLAAVHEFDFSRVHVFRYSPRPGTPAASRHDQVPEQVKRDRSEALQRAAQELFQHHARRLLGATLEVLFEQNNPSGRWEGLTPHYLRAEVLSDEPLSGEIAHARITGAGADHLLGELL